MERSSLIESRALAAAMFAGTLALGIWILPRLTLLPYLLPRCPMAQSFHIPCPTCGGTRALTALGRGEVLQAFYLNPLITLSVFAAFALCAIVGLSGLRRSAIVWRPSAIHWRYGRFVFFSALALNWVYVLLRSRMLDSSLLP